MEVTLSSPKSRKREQILAAARGLFWKHGFRRVSIEEVCQQAGASKMTFYRFWPNKIELAKAVFDAEVSGGVARFRHILNEETDPAEKVRKILLLKFESVHNISREFLHDFYANESLGLKAYVEEKTREAWQDMLVDFHKAQEAGIFRKDFNPEFLLLVSQTLGKALADDAFARLYPSPEDLIRELTNFIAYGITDCRIRVG